MRERNPSPWRLRLADRPKERRRTPAAFVPALLALFFYVCAFVGVTAATPLADPAVLPGSFVGGSSETEGEDVAVAPNGDLILFGTTTASDLPVTDASTAGGGKDVFVARFDPKVRELRWLVYLGGSNDDTAAAVAVDGSGNVYVTGTTDSTDFPTASAYDSSANGYSDVFVTKLAAADGSQAWSTYLGGSLWDEASDIAVDGNGRAIVVGTTGSNDFPTASPFGSNAYLDDAFVTRFAANGASLELSSYYGSVKHEKAVAVAVDEANDIYVGVFGRDHEIQYYSNEILKIDEYAKTLTWTYDLGSDYAGLYLEDIAVSSDGEVAFAGSADENQAALAIVNPWQAAPGGQEDLFAGKLNSAGSAILWSTYLGGSSGEGGASIALTSDEKVWITGYSDSADYPLRSSLFPNGGVASELSADGQELLASTRLGNWGAASLRGIAIAGGDVPVIGGTVLDAAELPLTGLLPQAPRPLYSWWYDAFILRLQPVESARFLPRKSVALPPLEQVIEPYPWGLSDLDSDGVPEAYLELPDRSLDLAWGKVVTDRFGDGRDLISVAIGTLDGARLAGAIDQDGDGEYELVVEDPRQDGGTVVGWLLDSGDEDVDLVVVGRGGATGALFADLDGDGELEVVVSSPHLADGAVARLSLDAPVDNDTDVLFIGGLPRAILDVDHDGELEVVAERAGTHGTTSTGSVEPVSDGDPDVLFLVGTYAFARDLDGDGVPELVAGDAGATPGTAAVVGQVLFVGGDPQTVADLDGDQELELVAYDSAASEGTFDPVDLLDGSDGDADVVFAGGLFRGLADVDGDHEPEIVVEDSGGTADTFAAVDGVEPVGDNDADLIAIRGSAVAALDLDDDGEQEIVADSAAQSAGAYAALDGAEPVGDNDTDVVFAGGAIRGFADLDQDWELELIAEDTGAGAGTFDALDGTEPVGDNDTDVLFIAGAWRAVRDLDGDGEQEVLAEDAGIGGNASAADGIEPVGDSDRDVVFVKAPFLTLRDLDADGEPEIVVEDGGLSAPSVGFSDFVENPGDNDKDLVRIPTTGAYRVADLDGDGEIELILERSGATAGTSNLVDGIEPIGDSDPDVIFIGGIPQLLVDLDGDLEVELVAEAGITAGTVSLFSDTEGPSDPDADLVFVGGTARGFADLDGDYEFEVAVENGSGGGTSRYDDVDGLSDPDADVVFTGGRVVRFTDVDNDYEAEAIAEDSALSPGQSSRYDDLDGLSDPDADVIYLAGVVQGELDLDLDYELEIAATDANLAGGTALDPTWWDGDNDSDGALIGIDTTPGSPSLAVTAPNGGGSVTIGNPLTITWSASGFLGTVRIELSRDGGTTWETLFANTNNDGSEVWTSDGAATSSALIRVTSRNLATPVSDDSDAMFTLL